MTWVKPGARNSSLSTVQVTPSDRSSVPTLCIMPPPTVIVSTLSASCTGHDGRSAPPSMSPNACTADSGSRLVVLGRGQQPVEIDLPRGERTLHLRVLAERELGRARERHRPLLGPVLERHLVQRRRRGRGFDLAAQPPRLVATARPLAETETAGRASVSVPVEARRGALEGQHAFGFEGHRLLVGLEAEAKARAIRRRYAPPKSRSR